MPLSKVDGTWCNELGSTVTFVTATDGKTLTGKYRSAKGEAKDDYDLVGQINPMSTSQDQAIGWVVVWNNTANGDSRSVTTWSGQYQLIDGTEEISTLWVLTSQESTAQDWSAHVVNRDDFYRYDLSEGVKSTPGTKCRKMAPAHPVVRKL